VDGHSELLLDLVHPVLDTGDECGVGLGDAPGA